jgi:hypothetical protein
MPPRTSTTPPLARTTLAVATLAVAGSLTAVAAGPADAAPRARSTVTIQADGVDLFGTVNSPRPARCADGRLVILYQQKGTRGGGDDIRIATDTAEKQGDTYVWSTGNTGIEGRFYAKVKRTAHCKRDLSPTIRAQRNP